MRVSVTLFTSLLIFSASTSTSVAAAPLAFRFSADVAHLMHVPRAPAPEPLVAPAVEKPAADAAVVPETAAEKKKRVIAPLTNAERLARGLPPASPASFVKRAIGSFMHRNLPSSDATEEALNSETSLSSTFATPPPPPSSQPLSGFVNPAL
ncbi:hypothetical protein M407DRAFT_11347 [Tulasnella calospora MUT 4182]|uniref:Uncharacterized protein n=1 Tax=Tulasnella calospora MUT 4182 TaxID=1051891 RepID=A0A0C3PWU4_9AGAM|nr:hypothetical protein M407DRAFT_11347 [Tulasnella calospora MUT 4182]